MIEDRVDLLFYGIEGTIIEGSIEGIRCPQCGTKYLLEDTVVEKVVEVEDQLSMK